MSINHFETHVSSLSTANCFRFHSSVITQASYLMMLFRSPLVCWLKTQSITFQTPLCGKLCSWSLIHLLSLAKQKQHPAGDLLEYARVAAQLEDSCSHTANQHVHTKIHTIITKCHSVLQFDSNSQSR